MASRSVRRETAVRRRRFDPRRTKKEGTAKSRPFLTNHSDAAIYPGEVSAPEQGGQFVRHRP
jgi:hypothetical protein